MTYFTLTSSSIRFDNVWKVFQRTALFKLATMQKIVIVLYLRSRALFGFMGSFHDNERDAASDAVSRFLIRSMIFNRSLYSSDVTHRFGNSNVVLIQIASRINRV